MKTQQKLLGAFAVASLILLASASTAHAVTFKGGARVSIPADQVVNDDLYVSASEFVLDGVVKGDLVVVGGNIVINGVVEGDIAAAGQSITFNGSARDDVRMGGAVVTLGSKAQIGDDFLFGGGSLEAMEGSVVNGSVMAGAAQGLMAGTIGEDMRFAGSRLSLRGPVGRDAYLDVDSAADDAGPQPWMFSAFMPNMPTWPRVPAGLTFGEGAHIAGRMLYSSTAQVTPPASVAREVVFTPRPMTNAAAPTVSVAPYTFGNWLLDALRSYVTLLLVGAALVWLLPRWLERASDEFSANPWHSLGYGALVALVVPAALLLLLAVAVGVALALGALTLSALSASVIVTVLAVVASGFVAFGLVLAYLVKIMVAYWVGRWSIRHLLPARWSAHLPAHGLHPLALFALGLLPVVLLAALPYVGGLITLLMAFVALGAIWLIVRPRLPLHTPTAQFTPAPQAG